MPSFSEWLRIYLHHIITGTFDVFEIFIFKKGFPLRSSHIPDDFAVAPSQPGVVDPCFNAGTLVFRPCRFHLSQRNNETLVSETPQKKALAQMIKYSGSIAVALLC